MFSIDGYVFLEIFFFGVKWLWDILVWVLIEVYDNGDMLINEVFVVVDGILGCNVLDFYKLEGKGGFLVLIDSLSKLN